MKKTMFVASFAVLAFSGLATAATTVVTDANLADYTGAAAIEIAAGDTLQFSGITSAFMPPGDYGSTVSGAANPNDSHFTGTGVLHVRRASLAEGFNLILR